MSSGWRPSPDHPRYLGTRPAAWPSRSPSSSLGGIKASGRRSCSPCAVTRSQLQRRSDGPCAVRTTDEDASAATIQEDPVGGMRERLREDSVKISNLPVMQPQLVSISYLAELYGKATCAVMACCFTRLSQFYAVAISARLVPGSGADVEDEGLVDPLFRVPVVPPKAPGSSLSLYWPVLAL